MLTACLKRYWQVLSRGAGGVGGGDPTTALCKKVNEAIGKLKHDASTVVLRFDEWSLDITRAPTSYPGRDPYRYNVQIHDVRNNGNRSVYYFSIGPDIDTQCDDQVTTFVFRGDTFRGPPGWLLQLADFWALAEVWLTRHLPLKVFSDQWIDIDDGEVWPLLTDKCRVATDHVWSVEKPSGPYALHGRKLDAVRLTLHQAMPTVLCAMIVEYYGGDGPLLRHKIWYVDKRE